MSIDHHLHFRISRSIWLILILAGCVYHDIQPEADCSDINTQLTLIGTLPVSSCASPNGVAEAEVSGDSHPFTFSIDGIHFQASPRFENLPAGDHIITARTKNNCFVVLNITLQSELSSLSAFTTHLIPDTKCLDNNGEVAIEIQGGVEPYVLKFDLQSTTTTSFSKLSHGQHTLQITDAAGCAFNLSFEIPRGMSDASWSRDIKPIIDSSCSKSECHAHGSGRSPLTTYNEVKQRAGQVKARTQSRSMPYDGSLTDAQIKLIGCWVDDGAPEN